ncbi:MAG: ATP-dependent RecD-like helicase [Actinomycetia bacterium]|nr:ATP-dependent RecD-like helicase [Actinomycetes bacterium]
MIASLVLSQGAPSGSTGWIETARNLINVAVSRPQQLLIVVGDALPITGLPATLHQLIGHAREDPRPAITDVPSPVAEAARRSLSACAGGGDARFELDYDRDAEGHAFPLALCRSDGSTIYIDIDAYAASDDHATFHRQLSRDTMLTAAGFCVFQIPLGGASLSRTQR